MNTEIIGFISGLLVTASSVPYGIRTYQGKVHPNLTTWLLWTLIGFVLLVTYISSGAKANAWPAVFGFICPLLITCLVFRKNSDWKKLDRIEIGCLFLGLLALSVWLVVRESKELSQWALYLAIAADLFAAIPTIIFVWKKPNEDRPFSWALFAVGYGLAIFAITEHTFSNYILPIYMFLGAFSITLPLIHHRWRNKVPLTEWI